MSPKKEPRIHLEPALEAELNDDARLERELEEARRRGDNYQADFDVLLAERNALRTSLEEARRLVTMYRAEDVKGQLSTLSEAYGELEADLKETTASLEEARQERDAARVSARTQKTKAQHARRAQRAMGARIEELEAALREHLYEPMYEDWMEGEKPSFAKFLAALQPTTEPGAEVQT